LSCIGCEAEIEPGRARLYALTCHDCDGPPAPELTLSERERLEMHRRERVLHGRIAALKQGLRSIRGRGGVCAALAEEALRADGHDNDRAGVPL
jgi:hypothetical protein